MHKKTKGLLRDSYSPGLSIRLLLLLLLAGIFSHGQTPQTITSRPAYTGDVTNAYFIADVPGGVTRKVIGGTIFSSLLADTNSVLATRTWVLNNFASGSGSGTGGAVSSVFGRAGAVTAQASDYSSFFVSTSGSYTNPPWLASLDSTKIPSLHSAGYYNTLYGTLSAQNTNAANIATILSYYNGSVIKPASLPIGSASALGAYKVGSGLSVDGAGVLSATTTGTVYSLNNHQYYGVVYAGSQTITLPSTPTVRPYWVQVFGSGAPTSLYSGFTWTSGSNQVTVSSPLQTGDSVVVHYDIGSALGKVNVTDINATGTASSTTFLNGAGQWAVPAGGASLSGTGYVKVTGTTITYDNTTFAPLASPGFTGVPTAPTATSGTNTTQLATTAFVTAAVAASTAGVSQFNGRTGAVVPQLADYSAFYFPLTGGNITGTAGSGYIGFPTQSSRPAAPPTGTLLEFTDSLGRRSYENSLGRTRAFEYRSNPTDASFVFQNKSGGYTVADSADVKFVVDTTLRTNIYTTYTGTWVMWLKPKGVSTIQITTVGGGGGGGGGLSGASATARGGGGGGASGSITRVVLPSSVVPDTLWVLVGAGGVAGTSSGAGGAGGTTYVSAQSGTTTAAYLVTYSVGGGGGGAGTSAAGGVGGTQAAFHNIGQTAVMENWGIQTSGAGSTGNAGGAPGSFAGTITLLQSSNIVTTQGTGGASVTTDQANKGGGSSLTTAWATGVAGGTAGGGNGNNGYFVTRPIYFSTGGTGGGSNDAGTGGAGGAGAIGSGGGGGGAGVTGGVGGAGGNGYAIINCW